MLINLFFLLGVILETFALQWTSSPTFPNGTRVNACLGDNVTFPWTYDVLASEHVIDIEWYQVLQNREVLVASYIGGRFADYSDLENKLHFMPNAGLLITGVTPSDLGLYFVRINLNGIDQPTSQTAVLHEPEVPVTTLGRLQTYILSTTQFPVINGESHLQLGCGNFTSLGVPPISVTWRTPSGQFRNSTYNNGVFVLTLPNPLEGGNYTCQLNELSTTLRCLQDNPFFHTTSTVYVDDATWTLLLLRNDVNWLREDNIRLDACGWQMIQRRQDGSVDFYRNWTEYENGFGNPASEYWIGLANLHNLTRNVNVRLRVDLTDFDGSTAYAVYNTFNISGPEDNYRLNVGGYSGTAGDSLEYHNRMQFSTFDRDHDTDSGNCAVEYHGAWWYAHCLYSNLNGRYKSDGASGGDGVGWRHWKLDLRSFKRVEMKIKQ